MQKLRIVVAAIVGLLTLPRVAPAFADEFGTPVPGQHVYDTAGVLTPAQTDMLEQRSSAFEEAGGRAIVYIRSKSATTVEAREDARSLMDAWDVQSVDGGHDGLVILFDLTPGDTRHGQVGLYAGRALSNAAPLPSDELQRIADQVMRPKLTNGDLSDAIAAGLDVATDDVKRGEPASGTPTNESANGGVLSLLLARLLVPGLLILAVFGLAVFGLAVGAAGSGARRWRGDGSSSSWFNTSSTGGTTSGGSDSASNGGGSGATSF